MQGPAAAAINARITVKSKTPQHQKEVTVTSYYEAIQYILETYATDILIVETDADTMRFT